jgi:hypothetical protein
VSDRARANDLSRRSNTQIIVPESMITLQEAITVTKTVGAQFDLIVEAAQAALDRVRASEKALTRKLEVAVAVAAEGESDNEEDAGLMREVDAADYIGVDPKTLGRWDADPSIGLPPPVWIGKRKYRDRAAMRQFKRTRMEAAA